MIEKVKKLLGVVDAQEKALLQTHVKAFEINFKAYKEEPTQANGNNLAFSKKACESEIEKLWGKYFPAERSFKSLPEVAEFLQSEGWKLSRPTIYNHEKVGHIRKGRDGGYSMTEVQSYIKRAGLQRVDGSAAGEEEDLQREKQLQETRKLAAQAEHWELKNRISSGELIDRAQVEQELAARAAILKSDMKNFWRKTAQEVIDLVGGDTEKTPELIEAGIGWSEQWLGRYAEDREFTAKIPVSVTAHEDLSEEDEDDDEE